MSMSACCPSVSLDILQERLGPLGFRRPQQLIRDAAARRPPGEDAASQEGPLQAVVAVDAAAAEAGGLACRVQARELGAVGPHDVALEVRLDAAQRLPRQQVHAHRDERAVLGVQQPVRRRDAAPPVGPVGAAVVDEHGLRVLGVGVVELAVAQLDGLADVLEAQHRPAALALQLVHALHQVLEVVAHDKVPAVLLEVLDGEGALLAKDAREELPHALARHVRVLLGAREGELAGDDALVEDEPRVVVARGADVLERAERVGAREQEGRQPLACRVEPQRARRRQHADAVVRPDGVPVLQALGVVPHAVAVDDVGAGRLRDADHAAVDVGRHADDKVLGHLGAEPVDGPRRLDGLDVAADAARGDGDGGSVEFKVAGHVAVGLDAARRVVGGEDFTADADGAAVLVRDDLVDAMAEAELDDAVVGGALDGLGEHPHDLGPRAPGDVEPGHRVAVALGRAGAPLGPADVEQEAHAPGFHVVLHLVGGEVDKGLGPAARPGVLLLAVELRRAEPVPHGELPRVLDAHPPLFFRVDAEDAAQRPERLAAEVLVVLLVEDDGRHAALRELKGCDQTGEATADDDGGPLEKLLLSLGAHCFKRWTGSRGGGGGGGGGAVGGALRGASEEDVSDDELY
ncbi:hypothetical protein CTA2_2171 [Colletotrichum tanaceti]|uniref:Uncharacterized protein n=1 Tax=Colletotrichum tanaceti TaxID=1306861 RepID=A0A4V6DIW7_9PEZI|nr:hypothetical protein CTA2_2171 [Colletotrichum tanaceti]TKW55046.1 hypothetical protein CTA1_13215 [Colletotrichum tanaceti]